MGKPRYSVGVIAGLVVAMHAAALTLAMSTLTASVATNSNGGDGGVMQARLVVRALPAVPPSLAPDAEPVSPKPPTPSQESAQANPGQSEAQATTDQGDIYFPRPLLSRPPRSMGQVVVPFPPEATMRGRFSTVLALFIDETGVVRRVRIDGPALPPALAEAAQESFLQAHFRPGELKGQQVKSLIRVEVVFDNTPIDDASGPRSL